MIARARADVLGIVFQTREELDKFVGDLLGLRTRVDLGVQSLPTAFMATERQMTMDEVQKFFDNE